MLVGAGMIATVAVLTMLSQVPELTPPPLVEAHGALRPKVEVQTVAEPEPEEDPFYEFKPHPRVSVGVFQGADGFWNGNGNLNLSLAGAYLRLGVQFTEHFGVEVEGDAASCGLTSTLRGAGWVEYTANDWVTFAGGGAAGASQAHVVGLFSPGFDTSADFLAVVERVDFHFISSRNDIGGRRAFTLGLQAEQGPNDRAPGGVAFGVFTTMGFNYW